MGRFAIQPLGMEVWPKLASAIEHVMVCGIRFPVDFIIGAAAASMEPMAELLQASSSKRQVNVSITSVLDRNQQFTPGAKRYPGRHVDLVEHVAKPPMSLRRSRMRSLHCGRPSGRCVEGRNEDEPV